VAKAKNTKGEFRLLAEEAVARYAHAIMIRKRRWLGAALVCLLALTTGGCITATLATVGTLFGLAGTAASTGSDVYYLGKLDFAAMAGQDQTRQAVRGAADDLSLHLLSDTLTDACQYEWTLRFDDDHRSVIEVTVGQRSDTLSVVRVNVGAFGNQTIAKLFAYRIRQHLPARASNPGE